MIIDLNVEIKRILHGAIDQSFGANPDQAAAGEAGGGLLGSGLLSAATGGKSDVVGMLLGQLQGAKEEGVIEDASPLDGILGQLMNLKGLIK